MLFKLKVLLRGKENFQLKSNKNTAKFGFEQKKSENC